MDSKSVHQLIRAEVWPWLRRQGFTRFDARAAWRDRGALIDVVRFELFRRFPGRAPSALSLSAGVYVCGSLHERWVKRDAQGCWRPTDGELSFRTLLAEWALRNGEWPAGAISEVLALLAGQAAAWFREFDDLDTVAGALSREDHTLARTVSAAYGSYVWNDLHECESRATCASGRELGRH